MWDTIGYGIPCLTATDDNLILNISSLDSGDALHEFNITGPEKYQVLDRHFHFVVKSLSPEQSNKEEDACYGLSFAHEKVAERFYQAIMQLVPKKPKDEPKLKETTNLLRGLSSSLKISPEEMTDFPRLIRSNSLMDRRASLEEAGALTLSGRFPCPLEESIEDPKTMELLYETQPLNHDDDVIDGRAPPGKFKFNRLRSSLKQNKSDDHTRKPRSMNKSLSMSLDDVNISFPTGFQHKAHVSHHTPFHALKEVINTGISPAAYTDNGLGPFRPLRRVPSAPNIQRYRNPSQTSNIKRPTILVTPPTKFKEYKLPEPPLAVSNFEAFLKEINTNKELLASVDEEQSDLTGSIEAWQQSFQSAVGSLVHRKLCNEELASKLLSFTQSGRQETCEKPTNRTSSVIIHDHGMVCL